MNYSEDSLKEAKTKEHTFKEFFLNVKDCLRSTIEFPKWDSVDLSLQESLTKAQQGVHHALCDNVDTRSAVFALKDLVGACNIYIQTRKCQNNLNGPLLKNAACFVTRILRIFGVIPSHEEETFGFRKEGSGEGIDEEEVVLPFVHLLSDFREKVRMEARSIENPAIKSSLLKECDDLRDEKLPLLGVRLEDHEGCPTVVKYVGKEAMQKEKELREKQEQEKEIEKQRKKLELIKIQEEKDAQKKIPPWELFRREGELDKYSQFDTKGIPTHDKDGNPIPKSQVKKLQKLFLAQEKKYNDYLVSLGETPTPQTQLTSDDSNTSISNSH